MIFYNLVDPKRHVKKSEIVLREHIFQGKALLLKKFDLNKRFQDEKKCMSIKQVSK